MMKNELIKIINTQFESNISENLSAAEARKSFIIFINDLIKNNFEKLVTILYKVDVNENKLKKLLKENPGKDAAEIITGLVIEREQQKIFSRKQFKK